MDIKKQVIVDIIDGDSNVFRAKFSNWELGNQYDHNVTELIINRPDSVLDAELEIIFEGASIGRVADVVTDNKYLIRNNFTLDAQVFIGFRFLATGAEKEKGTKVAVAFFAPSPQPPDLYVEDLPSTARKILSELDDRVTALENADVGERGGTVVTVDGVAQNKWSADTKADKTYVDELLEQIGELLDEINREVV